MSQYRAMPTSLRRVGAWALAAIALAALSAGAVVLGATPAGALAGVVTATPSTGLVDGQTITVDGSGWVPGHSIQVIECQIDALTFCDFGGGPVVTADTSGSFSLSLVVTRQLGPVDCSATPVTSKCAALAIDLNESPQPVVAYADLSFAPLPRVLPGGAVVAEGDSGTTDLLVPLALSFASTQTITVQWRTTSQSGPPPHADPASDFTVTSGVVTFAPGETAKTVTISVNGDVLVEPAEWIVVGFNHPTNAKMGGFWGLGFGVILNDD